jgi:hypothetical protein
VLQASLLVSWGLRKENESKVRATDGYGIAECGVLGVMNWDSYPIPASIDRSKLRKCREDPLGGRSLNKKESMLEKRACYPYTSGTCDNGYCWQSCGRNGGNDADYWC